VSHWEPEIGDEVFYNHPDGGRVGKVVGRVAEGELRAGQPIIEVLDDAPGRFAARKAGDLVVVHPVFLLPFRYGGPEWHKADREGRIR
jgi:hypothetical protein